MKIILPGAMPESKALCLKAKARGLACTVDQCDHSGGCLMLVLGDTCFSDDQQGNCKTCGAEPNPTTVFDRAIEHDTRGGK